MFQSPGAWVWMSVPGADFLPGAQTTCHTQPKFPSLCLNESCVITASTGLLLQTPARLLVILVRLKAAPVTKVSDTSTSPVSPARCCGCSQGFAKVRSKTQLAPTWLCCRVWYCTCSSRATPNSFYSGTNHWQINSWPSWGEASTSFLMSFLFGERSLH